MLAEFEESSERLGRSGKARELSDTALVINDLGAEAQTIYLGREGPRRGQNPRESLDHNGIRELRANRNAFGVGGGKRDRLQRPSIN